MNRGATVVCSSPIHRGSAQAGCNEGLACRGDRSDAHPNCTHRSLDAQVNLKGGLRLLLLQSFTNHAALLAALWAIFVVTAEEFHALHAHDLRWFAAKNAAKSGVDFDKAGVIAQERDAIGAGCQNRSQLLLVGAHPLEKFDVFQCRCRHRTQVTHQTQLFAGKGARSFEQKYAIENIFGDEGHSEFRHLRWLRGFIVLRWSLLPWRTQNRVAVDRSPRRCLLPVIEADSLP